MKAVAQDKEIEALRRIVVALQKECAAMNHKINSYYHEELILRGDKIMMREYREWFGIES